MTSTTRVYALLRERGPMTYRELLSEVREVRRSGLDTKVRKGILDAIGAGDAKRYRLDPDMLRDADTVMSAILSSEIRTARAIACALDMDVERVKVVIQYLCTVGKVHGVQMSSTTVYWEPCA